MTSSCMLLFPCFLSSFLLCIPWGHLGGSSLQRLKQRDTVTAAMVVKHNVKVLRRVQHRFVKLLYGKGVGVGA